MCERVHAHVRAHSWGASCACVRLSDCLHPWAYLACMCVRVCSWHERDEVAFGGIFPSEWDLMEYEAGLCAPVCACRLKSRRDGKTQNWFVDLLIVGLLRMEVC